MANNALHVLLFAAVAMFGIVDIHPFIDGNGRLSRVVANYALKQLPFPINLFATPAQRNEYVVAIERTRHVLSANCAYGDVSRDDLIQVIKYTGVFGSLVQLLIDRVARASTALAALWEEKSGLAAEAAEAKAARRVRERASRGTCMICLDEKPNIATLCCGNAIHLNCCAEWLSGNNKCPICRHEMPSISGRVVRAMEEPAEQWEEEDGEDDRAEVIERNNPADAARQYQNFVDRFWNEIRNNSARGRLIRYGADGEFSDDDQDIVNSTTTTSEEAEEEDTGERLMRLPRLLDAQGRLSAQGRLIAYDLFSDDEDEDRFTSTTTASEEDEDVGERLPVNANLRNDDGTNLDETTTASSDSNDSSFDEQDGERDDTTTVFSEEDIEDNEEIDTVDSTTTTTDGSEENTTTTTDYSDASSQEPQQCPIPASCSALTCRNRPAVDCANALCGSCCVLIGEYHCPRHNS